jgi:hypothetical protein
MLLSLLRDLNARNSWYFSSVEVSIWAGPVPRSSVPRGVIRK